MPRKGNFTEYQKPLDHSTDSGNKGGTPSDSWNNSMVGRPLSGRHSESVSENNKKYGIYSGHDIADHFGRSGSPTGRNPMKGK